MSNSMNMSWSGSFLSGRNQRFSLWKLNVRSCIAVLPLRTLLGLNPGTAMHMRRNSGMDETTPSDKGAFGQIQPSQQSRSSLGRCSTSSFPGSRCTAPALQDASPVHHISSMTRAFLCRSWRGRAFHWWRQCSQPALSRAQWQGLDP